MFHANFSSIDLVVWVFLVTIGQSNNAGKFDRIPLLTLTFYREREMRLWQPGVFDTLDHGCNQKLMISEFLAGRLIHEK